MNAGINIAVACGGGIFTTTVVTDKIKEIMRKEKIPCKITPQKISEISNLTGVDLIVVTGKTSQINKNGAPVLFGLPLFTGVGADEFIKEFMDTVRHVLEIKIT
jgi:PTS system galactitol-specific IIB component